MRKKLFCFLMALTLLWNLLCGCGVSVDKESEDSSSQESATEPSLSAHAQDQAVKFDSYDSVAPGYGIRAAIVYSRGEKWLDTLYYLEQSPMLGLEVQGLEVSDLAEIDRFDVLYLDESLLSHTPEGFPEIIEAYTQKGGSVFLPNSFCEIFSRSFLGISDLLKLDAFPSELSYPACESDEKALQQIIRDYEELYVRFSDFPGTTLPDYGYAFCPQQAMPLVLLGDTALYTLNQYGEGYVFLSNSLLPNAYSLGSLTMEYSREASAFASTTASFNQLLLSGFAEYVAKQRYGYALERAYGYYGTPSMAWELHYEEITGIENHSMEIFSELCRQYDQIPSFTLIRNSYTWFLRGESVSYLLNRSHSGYVYEQDFYENAYSSGTHIDAGGSWLTLQSVEDAGSYFLDYPQYTLRSYPRVVDLDGDGQVDILSGSSDGKVYYFRGKGYYEDRLHTYEAQALRDSSNKEISCGSYSAPCIAELNGDSFPDLILGTAEGRVELYYGQENGAFVPTGTVFKTDIRGQLLPAAEDLSGDRIVDLILGSDQGILIVYYGEKDSSGLISFSHTRARNLSKLCVNAELGNWLAPSVVDWNKDGISDLAVGVFHGYIALLIGQKDGSYLFQDYISTTEQNYKGNHRLKFGNWAVPVFADLNSDGKSDLLCGSLEYGIAYPIDSPYFPYSQELQEQVEYAKENHYYIGVHFYTNAYASAQRERYELSAHRKALEAYGIDTSQMGVNQHTWYTSSLTGSQSMSSIYEGGLFWQSGFAAPGSAVTSPQAAAENVLALPFYLMKDGERSLLIQNNSTLMYSSKEWNAISARYGMPVCIYYHCDFAYENSPDTIASLEAVQEFRETYGYNFNREDQLMLASAAALHQTVEVSGALSHKDGIELRSGLPSAQFDLYNEEVYQSLGLRMVFSHKVNAESLAVDADVWYREGNTLILGLNRPVRVYAQEQEPSVHLRRINMAGRITSAEQSFTVEFLSGGLMELSVEGYATTDCPGWKVLHRENETVFTKYGSKESLTIIF